MQKIILTSPLDMHLHLRDNDMLKSIAKCSINFAGGLIMPNLIPPIKTKQAVVDYRNRILKVMGDNSNFKPYMTLFYDNYNPEFLEDIHNEILAIKLYPAGITTNSEGGVSSFHIETMRRTLNKMSELNIPLCIHGETNGFVMDREKEFCQVYEMLATNFPDLKIIMEHITTKDSVNLLKKYDNLYATITLHHLLITLDDVVGGMLQPHLFCKPIAKRYEDRDALLEVALNGYHKVMFGSDSAPHPQHKKENCGCAAGVFTAPIAIQALCELFNQTNSLDNLQKFISDNAQKIYNITPPKKEIILERKLFKVPEKYGETVPMFANNEINWTIIN